jgi:hypothetical protein
MSMVVYLLFSSCCLGEYDNSGHMYVPGIEYPVARQIVDTSNSYVAYIKFELDGDLKAVGIWCLRQFRPFTEEDMRFKNELDPEIIFRYCPMDNLTFNKHMKPVLTNLSLSDPQIARLIHAQQSEAIVPQFFADTIQDILFFAIGEVFEDLELPGNHGDFLTSSSTSEEVITRIKCFLGDIEFLHADILDNIIRRIRVKEAITFSTIAVLPALEIIPSDCHALVAEIKKIPSIVDFINNADMFLV